MGAISNVPSQLGRPPPALHLLIPSDVACLYPPTKNGFEKGKRGKGVLIGT